MSEPRTTYETRWYDEPVTCCSRCHFVQFEGESNHAVWCKDDPPSAAAEMRKAGAPGLWDGEGT